MNTRERSALARVFDRNITNSEAHAIYAALGQFVENEETAEVESDDYTSDHKLSARAVLDRMDAAIAALAEP